MVSGFSLSARVQEHVKQCPTLYLAGILVLSVVLRVGVAFYLGDVVDAPPLLTDQRSYHALGVRLSTGYGFSFDRGWYPFTPANKPTAHWSFLYSLFIAVVYAMFGPHPLSVRLLQAVLGGLLFPYMVYRLTRRVLSPVLHIQVDLLALVAALLSAIYAYFALYAATLMTETFYMTALLLTLEHALILAERPNVRNGLFLGMALGLATLLRQSILPWAAVMFVWLLWAGYCRRAVRQMLGALTLSGLVLIVMILPFTLRNYRVYGRFLLLNSNAGYAMYSAQHPMHGTNFQEFAAAPIPDEWWGLNEAQMDRELMRLGIGFVLAEPGRYLLLCLSRVRAYFEFWPSPDTSLLHNLGRVGSFGLMWPLMAYGLWLTFRRESRSFSWRVWSVSPVALIVLFMLVYSVLHIVTWAMPRYRLPVDAVALIFAALAVVDLIRRVIVRRSQDPA